VVVAVGCEKDLTDRLMCNALCFSTVVQLESLAWGTALQCIVLLDYSEFRQPLVARQAGFCAAATTQRILGFELAQELLQLGLDADEPVHC
jgi:hypothetical protein